MAVIDGQGGGRLPDRLASSDWPMIEQHLYAFTAADMSGVAASIRKTRICPYFASNSTTSGYLLYVVIMTSVCFRSQR